MMKVLYLIQNTLSPNLLSLFQRVSQLHMLRGSKVADPASEQFVEIEILVDQKVQT